MRRKLTIKHLIGVANAGMEIVVVSSPTEYRRLARQRVQAEDRVLEIGCSTGEATLRLAKTGAMVLAVDVGAVMVAKAQALLAPYPAVTILLLDGRDVPALAQRLPEPTVIFVDIGGDATLDNVALQLRECLRTFSPRLLVVRSFELATLCSLVTECETPQDARFPQASSRDHAARVLDNLLTLSRCTDPDSRMYAARRLRHLRTPQGLERLAEMAADESHPGVRKAAAVALAAAAAAPPADAPAEAADASGGRKPEP